MTVIVEGGRVASTGLELGTQAVEFTTLPVTPLVPVGKADSSPQVEAGKVFCSVPLHLIDLVLGNQVLRETGQSVTEVLFWNIARHSSRLINQKGSCHVSYSAGFVGHSLPHATCRSGRTVPDRVEL